MFNAENKNSPLRNMNSNIINIPVKITGRKYFPEKRYGKYCCIK